MMLKHTKGDLLTMAEAGDFDVIVHGCNCFNTMGSGIARQVRSQYPMAWEEDQKTERGDMFKLGCFTSAHTGKFIIINAYTQYGTSLNGEDVFEYASFEIILKKLAYTYSGRKFGLPYIGMGLAGGDKDRIMAMIYDFARNVDVTLVEFG